MNFLGKVQEFIDPTAIEDKYTQLLNRAYTEIFQPMGFKRAGQNFRLFTLDGLGKIGAIYKGAEHVD